MDISLPSEVTTFTTVFLGIFIEAAPFLLLGTLASGLLEVFVSREDLTRVVPRGIIPATIMGGMMGFAFPVCECGVVPVTRRLFKKGFPISAGIAFLLAAPIINPVAIASTYAAYGFSDMLILRFVMGFSIPVTIGLIFALSEAPRRILLPQLNLAPVAGASGLGDAKHLNPSSPKPQEPIAIRLKSATRIASDEFFDMAKYLIIGSILAALMQTFVSRAYLEQHIGSGPVLSVIFMQVLAFVLSVCSTVDAFISLSFRSQFTTGSLLGFLVFGPMVDIKSTLMFLQVFRRKIVFYLIALPFLLTLLVAVFINLNVGI
jgi:hypothetical protein